MNPNTSIGGPKVVIQNYPTPTWAATCQMCGRSAPVAEDIIADLLEITCSHCGGRCFVDRSDIGNTASTWNARSALYDPRRAVWRGVGKA